MAEGDQPNRTRVFLSYSRRDRHRADEIVDALSSDGVEVLRDTKDIMPAEDWRKRLEALIEAADAIVFLVSPASVASEVCQWEIETADSLTKRILPYVIEDVPYGATPPTIERLNYIFARPGDDADEAWKQLLAAIDTDIDWVREHTRLFEHASEWSRDGARTALLRGRALERAETWLASAPASGPAPTERHRAWITESRRASVRRQRAWVTGALAVAAVSIGLGIVAEVNRRIAAEERDRAERILDRGSATANDLVFDLAQRFRDEKGVPQDLIVDILGRSKGLVDMLAQSGEDRPDLLRSRGAALTELSLTLLRQQDLEGALETAQQALVNFEILRERLSDSPEALADLAVAYDRLGDVYLARDDTENARAAFARARDINQRLAAERPDAADARLNLAISHEKLGGISLDQDAWDAARNEFETAFTVLAPPERRGRTAAILKERLGDSLAGLGETANAITEYEASLAITRQLADANPTDTVLMRDLSVIHQKLGDQNLEAGEIDAAIHHFERDLAQTEALIVSDPERLDWRRDLATSFDRLGMVHHALGESELAADRFEAAWAVARRLASAAPTRLDLISEASLSAQKAALTRFDAGMPGRSLVIVTRDKDAIEEFRGATGEGSGLYADALNNVAWYALFAGEADRAVSSARLALDLAPDTMGYQLNLAHGLMMSGEREAGLRIHRENLNDPATASEWRNRTLSDLEAFEQAGLAQSAVDEIRHLLNTTEPK